MKAAIRSPSYGKMAMLLMPALFSVEEMATKTMTGKSDTRPALDADRVNFICGTYSVCGDQ